MVIYRKKYFCYTKTELRFKDKFRGKIPKELNAYQFLGAAKQSIENSSFHAIPWVTQDIHWLTKVIFYSAKIYLPI